MVIEIRSSYYKGWFLAQDYAPGRAAPARRGETDGRELRRHRREQRARLRDPEPRRCPHRHRLSGGIGAAGRQRTRSLQQAAGWRTVGDSHSKGVTAGVEGRTGFPIRRKHQREGSWPVALRQDTGIIATLRECIQQHCLNICSHQNQGLVAGTALQLPDGLRRGGADSQAWNRVGGDHSCSTLNQVVRECCTIQHPQWPRHCHDCRRRRAMAKRVTPYRSGAADRSINPA